MWFTTEMLNVLDKWNCVCWVHGTDATGEVELTSSEVELVNGSSRMKPRVSPRISAATPTATQTTNVGQNMQQKISDFFILSSPLVAYSLLSSIVFLRC